MKREQFEVIRGSGNVVRDLGKDNPDLTPQQRKALKEMIKTELDARRN